ncbi:hypothetical protein RUM43_010260 [Polyplax serrata]|uniref:Meckel syndrome type 1 protein n=1 Tax=Polyplax serrata TaxID=468196 RepID=A0AAN8S7Y6_POLSC
MSFECEREYSTSYYRCIDPIENFKIRVTLKPVKNLFIPFPQFDVNYGAGGIPFFEEDSQQQEVEEYTFCWQEKVFSQSEIKKMKDSSSAMKKCYEKYHKNVLINKDQQNYPQKLFSYVEVDNYQQDNKNSSKISKKKISRSTVNRDKNFKHGNIPKAKIVNYCPSHEFKGESDGSNDKYNQKMFIMIDLGPCNSNEENHEVLCVLQYNTGNKLLEITPSFSLSDKPYIIGGNSEDNRNSYYYWLVHASSDISSNCLRKEIGLMTKVLNHQEELKNLLIGTEFTAGQPNYLYVTLLGDIISGENFEYNHLHVNYYIKLPTGWECTSASSLSGATQTGSENSQGVTHFSHPFEFNLFTDLQSFEDYSASSPEIIFEVVSVDKFSRYRNEGYCYVHVPIKPGMYEYSLQCWRPVNKTIRSQLERFFIGGGPELEDVSYAGLSNAEKIELINRFGFETVPSGKINFKMSLLHQSETFKRKFTGETIADKENNGRSETDALLCSINTVLEAFRKARERMLEAKKGLDCDLNNIQSDQPKNVDRKDTGNSIET